MNETATTINASNTTSTKLNELNNISLMNFKNYLKCIKNDPEAPLLLRDYNPKPSITVAVNQNHYTLLPKHVHTANSHKNTNVNNKRKRFNIEQQPIIVTIDSSKSAKKKWSPSKYDSIIRIVNRYINERLNSAVNEQICWNDVFVLWIQMYPNDATICNPNQIKNLYLTATRKLNSYHNSNNQTTINNTNYGTISNNHNNIANNNTYNDIQSIDLSNNDDIISSSDHISDNNNINITMSNTSNNHNMNTNNINGQLIDNNHTTLRKPDKLKQPFSREELSILNNAIDSYRTRTRKKSINWDKIHFLYDTEASKQYSHDNSKPIYAKTKQQLEEKYKSSIRKNK